jgi:Holliday junction resolvase RusA-like endonuclease
MAKIGNGYRAYAPAKYRKYLDAIAAYYEDQGFENFGPELVAVRIAFYLPRPKAHYVNNTPGPDRLKKTAPEYPEARKDIDNFIKGVLDGLIGKAYDDDCQVIVLSAVKLYAEQDPQIQLQITRLSEHVRQP